MPGASTKAAADARLQVFAGRAWVYAAGLAALVSLGFVAMLLTVAFFVTGEPGAAALKIDFRVFWGAGQLALTGEPLAVHDQARLAAAHATFMDEFMPWLYPPGFLVLVTPFGALSFAMAYLVWTLLSLILVAWALRPFVAGIGPLWVLVALAPAYYAALFAGQTSMLWMAGLLAALASLRDGRMLLAGVFIGCLTLKPQLGLMIPFALLAIGVWRTILAATATALVVQLLPTLYYGLEYWRLLQTTLTELRAWVAASLDTILLMIGPAFLLGFAGAPDALAWAVQLAIALIALATVVILWRSRDLGFDVKAAGLLAAILLSAPYLWWYEAVLMAPIALFLLRGGVLRLRLPDAVLLATLWLGTGLQAVNVFLKLVDQRWLGAAIVPPVLLVALALCLREAFRPVSAR
jgi:hypothetical protein